MYPIHSNVISLNYITVPKGIFIFCIRERSHALRITGAAESYLRDNDLSLSFYQSIYKLTDMH